MMLSNFNETNTAVYNSSSHVDETNSKEHTAVLPPRPTAVQSIEPMRSTKPATAAAHLPPTAAHSHSWGSYPTHQLDGFLSGCYSSGNPHQPVYAAVDQYKSNPGKYHPPPPHAHPSQHDYHHYATQYPGGTIHHPIPVKCNEVCCQHLADPPRYHPPHPSFQFPPHHMQPPRYSDYHHPHHHHHSAANGISKQYLYNSKKSGKMVSSSTPAQSSNSGFSPVHSDLQNLQKYSHHHYPHQVATSRQKEIKQPTKPVTLETTYPVYPVMNSYWAPRGWVPPPYHQAVPLPQYKTKQDSASTIHCTPAFQTIDHSTAPTGNVPEERKGVIMNSSNNNVTSNSSSGSSTLTGISKTVNDYHENSAPYRTDCFDLSTSYINSGFPPIVHNSTNKITINNITTAPLRQSSHSQASNINLPCQLMGIDKHQPVVQSELQVNVSETNNLGQMDTPQTTHCINVLSSGSPRGNNFMINETTSCNPINYSISNNEMFNSVVTTPESLKHYQNQGLLNSEHLSPNLNNPDRSNQNVPKKQPDLDVRQFLLTWNDTDEDTTRLTESQSNALNVTTECNNRQVNREEEVVEASVSQNNCQNNNVKDPLWNDSHIQSRHHQPICKNNLGLIMNSNAEPSSGVENHSYSINSRLFNKKVHDVSSSCGDVCPTLSKRIPPMDSHDDMHHAYMGNYTDSKMNPGGKKNLIPSENICRNSSRIGIHDSCIDKPSHFPFYNGFTNYMREKSDPVMENASFYNAFSEPGSQHPCTSIRQHIAPWEHISNAVNETEHSSSNIGNKVVSSSVQKGAFEKKSNVNVVEPIIPVPARSSLLFQKDLHLGNKRRNYGICSLEESSGSYYNEPSGLDPTQERTGMDNGCSFIDLSNSSTNNGGHNVTSNQIQHHVHNNVPQPLLQDRPFISCQPGVICENNPIKCVVNEESSKFHDNSVLRIPHQQLVTKPDGTNVVNVHSGDSSLDLAPAKESIFSTAFLAGRGENNHSNYNDKRENRVVTTNSPVTDNHDHSSNLDVVTIAKGDEGNCTKLNMCNSNNVESVLQDSVLSNASISSPLSVGSNYNSSFSDVTRKTSQERNETSDSSFFLQELPTNNSIIHDNNKNNGLKKSSAKDDNTITLHSTNDNISTHISVSDCSSYVQQYSAIEKSLKDKILESRSSEVKHFDKPEMFTENKSGCYVKNMSSDVLNMSSTKDARDYPKKSGDINDDNNNSNIVKMKLNNRIVKRKLHTASMKLKKILHHKEWVKMAHSNNVKCMSGETVAPGCHVNNPGSSKNGQVIISNKRHEIARVLSMPSLDDSPGPSNSHHANEIGDEIEGLIAAEKNNSVRGFNHNDSIVTERKQYLNDMNCLKSKSNHNVDFPMCSTQRKDQKDSQLPPDLPVCQISQTVAKPHFINKSNGKKTEVDKNSINNDKEIIRKKLINDLDNSLDNCYSGNNLHNTSNVATSSLLDFSKPVESSRPAINEEEANKCTNKNTSPFCNSPSISYFKLNKNNSVESHHCENDADEIDYDEERLISSVECTPGSPNVEELFEDINKPKDGFNLELKSDANEKSVDNVNQFHSKPHCDMLVDNTCSDMNNDCKINNKESVIKSTINSIDNNFISDVYDTDTFHCAVTCEAPSIPYNKCYDNVNSSTNLSGSSLFNNDFVVRDQNRISPCKFDQITKPSVNNSVNDTLNNSVSLTECKIDERKNEGLDTLYVKPSTYPSQSCISGSNSVITEYNKDHESTFDIDTLCDLNNLTLTQCSKRESNRKSDGNEDVNIEIPLRSQTTVQITNNDTANVAMDLSKESVRSEETINKHDNIAGLKFDFRHRNDNCNSNNSFTNSEDLNNVNKEPKLDTISSNKLTGCLDERFKTDIIEKDKVSINLLEEALPLELSTTLINEELNLTNDVHTDKSTSSINTVVEDEELRDTASKRHKLHREDNITSISCIDIPNVNSVVRILEDQVEEARSKFYQQSKTNDEEPLTSTKTSDVLINSDRKGSDSSSIYDKKDTVTNEGSIVSGSTTDTEISNNVSFKNDCHSDDINCRNIIVNKFSVRDTVIHEELVKNDTRNITLDSSDHQSISSLNKSDKVLVQEKPFSGIHDNKESVNAGLSLESHSTMEIDNGKEIINVESVTKSSAISSSVENHDVNIIDLKNACCETPINENGEPHSSILEENQNSSGFNAGSTAENKEMSSKVMSPTSCEVVQVKNVLDIEPVYKSSADKNVNQEDHESTNDEVVKTVNVKPVTDIESVSSIQDKHEGSINFKSATEYIETPPDVISSQENCESTMCKKVERIVDVHLDTEAAKNVLSPLKDDKSRNDIEEIVQTKHVTVERETPLNITSLQEKRECLVEMNEITNVKYFSKESETFSKNILSQDILDKTKNVERATDDKLATENIEVACVNGVSSLENQKCTNDDTTYITSAVTSQESVKSHEIDDVEKTNDINVITKENYGVSQYAVLPLENIEPTKTEIVEKLTVVEPLTKDNEATVNILEREEDHNCTNDKAQISHVIADSVDSRTSSSVTTSQKNLENMKMETMESPTDGKSFIEDNEKSNVVLSTEVQKITNHDVEETTQVKPIPVDSTVISISSQEKQKCLDFDNTGKTINVKCITDEVETLSSTVLSPDNIKSMEIDRIERTINVEPVDVVSTLENFKSPKIDELENKSNTKFSGCSEKSATLENKQCGEVPSNLLTAQMNEEKTETDDVEKTFNNRCVTKNSESLVLNSENGNNEINDGEILTNEERVNEDTTTLPTDLTLPPEEISNDLKSITNNKSVTENNTFDDVTNVASPEKSNKELKNIINHKSVTENNLTHEIDGVNHNSFDDVEKFKLVESVDGDKEKPVKVTSLSENNTNATVDDFDKCTDIKTVTEDDVDVEETGTVDCLSTEIKINTSLDVNVIKTSTNETIKVLEKNNCLISEICEDRKSECDQLNTSNDEEISYENKIDDMQNDKDSSSVCERVQDTKITLIENQIIKTNNTICNEENKKDDLQNYKDSSCSRDGKTELIKTHSSDSKTFETTVNDSCLSNKSEIKNLNNNETEMILAPIVDKVSVESTNSNEIVGGQEIDCSKPTKVLNCNVDDMLDQGDTNTTVVDMEISDSEMNIIQITNPVNSDNNLNGFHSKQVQSETTDCCVDDCNKNTNDLKNNTFTTVSEDHNERVNDDIVKDCDNLTSCESEEINRISEAKSLDVCDGETLNIPENITETVNVGEDGNEDNVEDKRNCDKLLVCNHNERISLEKTDKVDSTVPFDPSPPTSPSHDKLDLSEIKNKNKDPPVPSLNKEVSGNELMSRSNDINRLNSDNVHSNIFYNFREIANNSETSINDECSIDKRKSFKVNDIIDYEDHMPRHVIDLSNKNQLVNERESLERNVNQENGESINLDSSKSVDVNQSHLKNLQRNRMFKNGQSNVLLEKYPSMKSRKHLRYSTRKYFLDSVKSRLSKGNRKFNYKLNLLLSTSNQESKFIKNNKKRKYLLKHNSGRTKLHFIVGNKLTSSSSKNKFIQEKNRLIERVSPDDDLPEESRIVESLNIHLENDVTSYSECHIDNNDLTHEIQCSDDTSAKKYCLETVNQENESSSPTDEVITNNDVICKDNDDSLDEDIKINNKTNNEIVSEDSSETGLINTNDLYTKEVDNKITFNETSQSNTVKRKLSSEQDEDSSNETICDSNLEKDSLKKRKMDEFPTDIEHMDSSVNIDEPIPSSNPHITEQNENSTLEYVSPASLQNDNNSIKSLVIDSNSCCGVEDTDDVRKEFVSECVSNDDTTESSSISSNSETEYIKSPVVEENIEKTVQPFENTSTETTLCNDELQSSNETTEPSVIETDFVSESERHVIEGLESIDSDTTKIISGNESIAISDIINYSRLLEDKNDILVTNEERSKDCVDATYNNGCKPPSVINLDNSNSIVIIIEELCNSEDKLMDSGVDKDSYVDEEQVNLEVNTVTSSKTYDNDEENNDENNSSCCNFEKQSATNIYEEKQFVTNVLDDISINEVEVCTNDYEEKQNCSDDSTDEEFHGYSSGKDEVSSNNDPSEELSTESSSEVLKGDKTIQTSDQKEESKINDSEVVLKTVVENTSINDKVVDISLESSKSNEESLKTEKDVDKRCNVISIFPTKSEQGNLASGDNMIKPIIKCSLPWERIFNTAHSKKRKVTRKPRHSSKSGIELGPAQIELRVGGCEQRQEMSNGSALWKVVANDLTNTGNGNSVCVTPVVKVKRLILQRDPELTSYSEDSACSSNLSASSDEDKDVNFAKRSGSPCSSTVDERSSNSSRSIISRRNSTCSISSKNSYSSMSSRSSSSSTSTIPKVLIKKMRQSEYKSFLKVPNQFNKPVVKLIRCNLIDNLALKNKTSINLFNEVVSDKISVKSSSDSVSESNEAGDIEMEHIAESTYNTPTNAAVKEFSSTSQPAENSHFELSDVFSETSSCKSRFLHSIKSTSTFHICDNILENNEDSIQYSALSNCDVLSLASKECDITIDDRISSPSSFAFSGMKYDDIDVLDLNSLNDPFVNKCESDKESDKRASVATKRRLSNDSSSGDESSDSKRSPRDVTKYMFHCQRCLLVFNNKEEVMTHQAAVHPSHQELHHCMLCQRSFSTLSKHTTHIQSRNHRRLELMQRCTIHAMHRYFTGRDCPRLYPMTPAELKSFDWRPNQPGCIHFYHHPSPLQLALQENPWGMKSKNNENLSSGSTTSSRATSPTLVTGRSGSVTPTLKSPASLTFSQCHKYDDSSSSS